LTAIAGEHSAAQGLVQDSTTQIEQLTLERGELGQERERINVQDLDGSALAEERTRDLATLFGREELSFGKEGKRYSIQRNGLPATDLSEGERTAISLLYFLCSLRDERTRGISATVLIDDPCPASITRSSSVSLATCGARSLATAPPTRSSCSPTVRVVPPVEQPVGSVSRSS
jgi:hypothetical protein